MMTKLKDTIATYAWNTLKVGVPAGLMLFGATSCQETEEPQKPMTEVGTDASGREIKAYFFNSSYDQNATFIRSFTVSKEGISIYVEPIAPYARSNVFSMPKLILNDTEMADSIHTQVRKIIYTNSNDTTTISGNAANTPFYQNLAKDVLRSIDSLYAVKEKALREKILNTK